MHNEIPAQIDRAQTVAGVFKHRIIIISQAWTAPSASSAKYALCTVSDRQLCHAQKVSRSRSDWLKASAVSSAVSSAARVPEMLSRRVFGRTFALSVPGFDANLALQGQR